MIVWREKFLATTIHFMVTLTVGAIAAALIFLVWFPDPLQTMIGGTGLFMLVVGCDLVLGPLLSLVIYDSRKSRRALIFDYAVVGTVQIAALVYGVTIVSGTRPVYVAFSLDRLEIVSAGDINEKELAAARNAVYRTLPISGPRYVGIQIPESEHNDALFEALDGNEEQFRPKFYVPYETQLEAIRTRAKPIEALAQKNPASKPLLEAAMRDVSIPAERVRWLPVHYGDKFWTALIDYDDGKPVTYFDFDPY